MTAGFSIPYVVTSTDKTPDYRSFSFGPRLFSSSLHHPPKVDDEISRFSREESKCLQVLARNRKGIEEEIASLTGLPETMTYDVLQRLKRAKWWYSNLASSSKKTSRSQRKWTRTGCGIQPAKEYPLPYAVGGHQREWILAA